MNPFVKHLPGLLDDPQFQITDLPARLDLRIAPLRDPVPSRALSVPSPLEPNAPQDAEGGASKAKLGGRKIAVVSTSVIASPKITPADFVLAKDGDGAKKPNIAIAISELVESTSKSAADHLFVSLSAVEKSFLPGPAFNSDDSRKRLRLDFDDTVFEDYIHLPRPHQKEHGTRTAPLLPAIVNGLHEPPPNAALLPPMSMEKERENVVEDPPTRVIMVAAEGARRPPEKMINSPEIERDLGLSDAGPVQEQVKAQKLAYVEKPGSKQMKTGKPRKSPRKWTGEETENLLLGVAKHGIGNWKRILADPTYTFESRRAMDLKDRFRVCAPDMYNVQRPSGTTSAETPLRNSSPSTTNRVPTRTTAIVAKSTGILSENIIEIPLPSATKAATPDSPSKPVYPGKERVSSDRLAELGITPQAKLHSGRRTRRAWTAEEDESLLKGVAKHGFQWTAIHDDQEFDFSHRKARDLRDRIRNRFPEGYKNADTAPLRSGKAPPAAAAAAAVKQQTTNPQTNDAAAKSKPKRTRMPKPDGENPTTTTTTTSSPPPAAIDEAVIRASFEDVPPAPEPPSNNNSNSSAEMVAQEHLQAAGTTLPPLTLGDDGWDWGNNTLAPLLDWEDMVL